MRPYAPFALLLLTASCGDLGPTPTEKVLASQKKEEPPAAYSDPYSDGKKLEEQRQALRPSCDDAKQKLSSLDQKGLKLTKEDKEAISAASSSLTTACAADSADLPTVLKNFSDASARLLTLAGDYRGRAMKGVDLYRGTVDASKAKEEKLYTQHADTFELGGKVAIDYLMAYLMFAPLEQRKQTATAVIELGNKLPPDYEEDLTKKKLGKAMTAEGDEALRKLLRAEVYGVLPE